MTTQVVNLLHLRSLTSGEIPVNMEFGSFAINVFNAENPVLPTLRDVSLFIGTGGNERVDEDGTDRSADVALASGFAGEAIQANKGWVRYTLRKVRATGDTIVGDINISGASLKFDVGSAGSAQLILPTELVNTAPTTAGSVRWNDTTKALEIWDGAIWRNQSSGITFQEAAAAPTIRADGTALVVGDLWFDTVNKVTKYWSSLSVWTELSDQYDFQTVTGSTPAVRSDGASTLVAGDWWYDNSATEPYLYVRTNAGGWLNTSDGGTF